jgi:hypothetical protein
MVKFRKILTEAFISTSRFPRWWILALVQACSLYLMGEFLQPHYWLHNGGFLVWPVLAVFIMSPAISWLWLDIESCKEKTARKTSLKSFIDFTKTSSAIIFCSLLLMIAAKLAYPDWLFSALFSSIISATATLAILFVVLCRQPFNRALMLALDTWTKKISMAAIVAFVLLLAHGVSFALVHGVLKSFASTEGFSVLTASATIWILFLALMVIVAFLAAFLNCFLVFFFLEIIGQKKDPEAEKAVLSKLVASEVNSYSRSSLKII